MSTPSTNTLPPPRRATIAAKANNVNLPIFRPPALNLALTMDIAKEIEAIRRRRAMFGQRIGSAWPYRGN